MIRRFILHIEMHRRYRPHISLRQAPRHGDRVTDGGTLGTLIRCETCSGGGFLHRPDRMPEPIAPGAAS